MGNGKYSIDVSSALRQVRGMIVCLVINIVILNMVIINIIILNVVILNMVYFVSVKNVGYLLIIIQKLCFIVKLIFTNKLNLYSLIKITY